MRFRTARLCLTAPTALLLIAATGCGPQFFSVKGTVNSSGGPLDKWSAAPLGCSRDEFDGDSSKLIGLQFGWPKNDDPDRDLHYDKLPNGPASIKLAKNGTGIIGKIDMLKPVKAGAAMGPEMASIDGYTLDSSNCKTLTLDREEQSGNMGDHKQLKGHFVMDCTVLGSHITGDLKFNHCGM
jgi:hypothetical protein